MSTLAVTGNALGTGVVTLTSPNTNTNQTISLPDATATVLSIDGSGNVNNTSGTVNLGSGQVVKDSSGNLGLGVTPPTQNGGTGYWAAKGAFLSDGNSLYPGIHNAYYNSGWKYTSTGYAQFYIQDDLGKHAWHTAPSGTAGNAITFTQAMTLDASGNLLVGTTSGNYHTFTKNNASNYTVRIQNTTASSPYALGLNNPNAASAGYFLVCDDTVNRLLIFGSGNVQNANNSYGGLSDAKLKENVVDATPKLDKLCQVRIVNYNLKGDYEQHKQIGVIAQELEQIFPGMVEETPDRDAEGNDLGTVTKSVKYSVFVPMLIKAMQEQQAMIEELRAEVAALKAKA